MDEKIKHELKIKIQTAREDSSVVIQGDKSACDAELGTLASCIAAIKTPPPQPSSAQLEEARLNLLRQIDGSRPDAITTLRDKMTATDSLFLKAFYYGAIALAAIIAAAAIAAGIIYLLETLFSQPANAAQAFDSLARGCFMV